VTRPFPLRCAAVALMIVLACVSGCRATPARSPSLDWRLADKVESFRPFLAARLGNNLLANFLASHTAGVSHGAEVIGSSTRPTTGPSNSFSIEVQYREQPDGSSPTTFIGSAAPITEDGYILTAAHCVMPAAPVYVIIAARANVPRVLPARVVWSGWTGETGDPESDLAVLHVEHVALRPLQSAADDDVVAGAQVYLSGQSGPSAGRILRDPFRVTRRTGRAVSPNVHLIFHGAPCVEADSGGPLVSAEGRLIGINRSTHQRVDRSAIATLALRPDVRWLESLINLDRRRTQRAG